MSAKDDLDRFDRDWALHREWRTGKRRGWDEAETAEGESSYLLERGGLGQGFHVPKLPAEVRAALFQRFDRLFDAMLHELWVEQRKELSEKAIREARETLKELEAVTGAVNPE